MLLFKWRIDREFYVAIIAANQPNFFSFLAPKNLITALKLYRTEFLTAVNLLTLGFLFRMKNFTTLIVHV